MSKSSEEIIERAKKLMERAKLIEEQEFVKVGKQVLKLYKQKNLKDDDLNLWIKNFLGKN